MIMILAGASTVAAVAWAQSAYANSSICTIWDPPLNPFSGVLHNPVALTVLFLILIAAGAILIWGREVNEFAGRMAYLVLVICILVLASPILINFLEPVSS